MNIASIVAQTDSWSKKRVLRVGRQYLLTAYMAAISKNFN